MLHVREHHEQFEGGSTIKKQLYFYFLKLKNNVNLEKV